MRGPLLNSYALRRHVWFTGLRIKGLSAEGLGFLGCTGLGFGGGGLWVYRLQGLGFIGVRL